MDSKIIHMTYKCDVPRHVFGRWMKLNPSYAIRFSKDLACFAFIEQHFGAYVAQLFIRIPKGMYKADLWRLCKLYIEGGVYADVDLVPHCSIDKLIGNKKITFYSCLAVDKQSIFQAFIICNAPPRSPLILCFLMSFLLNNPYNTFNGPTYDMYKCLKYNLGCSNLRAEIKYKLNVVRIPVHLGASPRHATKAVPLRFFPANIAHKIVIRPHVRADELVFEIHDNILVATRIDEDCGWTYPHSCDIVIDADEYIYLFPEKQGDIATSNKTCFVADNDVKILESRDPAYARGGGWQ